MGIPIPFRSHSAESNFLRAFRGETLYASRILDTGRRIIVVSVPRTISSTDDVAVIELPPARRWLHKELTIIGAGFRLAPAAGESVQGEVAGRYAVRLVPLLNDRADEPDSWAVVG
jgi:hypothetical protein